VPEGGAEQEVRRQEEERRRTAAELVVALLVEQIDDVPWLVQLIEGSDIEHTLVAKLLREHPANTTPIRAKHVPPPPSRRMIPAAPPRDVSDRDPAVLGVDYRRGDWRR
jgi:hypothetical protein